MKSSLWIVTILTALVFITSVQAIELGDKAPELQIAEWVKGEPVDVTVADGNQVFVVEFWATWCGPCRTSIPHLSGMQQQYKDKNVTIIGVSTDSKQTVGKVKPFVKELGDKMNYTVAIDKDRATWKAYMEAFGQGGIPHAFLIDQKGRIVWHDHPMANFEAVIEQVIDGTFDLEKAKRQKRVYALVDQYMALASNREKSDELAKLGDQILADGKDNSSLMNEFAWAILTAGRLVHRDLALALKIAEAANTASEGKDADVLDTYALALFENGQKKKAVEIQAKAVELAKENRLSEGFVSALKDRLEKYKQSVE